MSFRLGKWVMDQSRISKDDVAQLTFTAAHTRIAPG